MNPAAAVRGPKHVVTKGATPVLSPAEAMKLLETIDTGALAGLRDRALLSVMLYSFARVSAVLGMRRQDYFGQGSRGWLRLHEKGGRRAAARRPGPPPGVVDPRRARGGGRARGAEGGAVPDAAGRRLSGRPLDAGAAALHGPDVSRLALLVRLPAADGDQQHSLAVGRVVDVGPAEGADLAPPHPRHEEEPRDRGGEAAALKGDGVGLDAAAD